MNTNKLRENIINAFRLELSLEDIDVKHVREKVNSLDSDLFLVSREQRAVNKIISIEDKSNAQVISVITVYDEYPLLDLLSKISQTVELKISLMDLLRVFNRIGYISIVKTIYLEL